MLELSTKHAIKALLHLAELKTDEYVQVKTLSKETKIPGPYLSKLIKRLAAKGIVDTKRGSLGGVRMPLCEKHISFFDVCEALDDPILSKSCFLSRHACSSRNPCVAHKHWSEMKDIMIGFLKSKKI
jgi:Rrf2 family transcriptional regulator, iron-sulfur cluster assembly transcription factor